MLFSSGFLLQNRCFNAGTIERNNRNSLLHVGFAVSSKEMTMTAVIGGGGGQNYSTVIK